MRNKIVTILMMLPIAANASVIDFESPNTFYSTDKGKFTAMMMFAQEKFSLRNVEAAKKIASHESFNPYVKDSRGKTALDYAIEYHRPILKEIILSKSDYRMGTSDKSLLDSKLSDYINSIAFEAPEDKNEFIVSLVKSGYVKSLEAFVHKEDIKNLDIFDKNGLSPMMATALEDSLNGNEIMIDKIISLGGRIDSTTYKSGLTTPLQLACAYDNYRVAATLLKKGANPFLKNSLSQDTLAVSQANGSKMCMLILHEMITSALKQAEG